MHCHGHVFSGPMVGPSGAEPQGLFKPRWLQNGLFHGLDASSVITYKRVTYMWQALQ